MCNSSLFILLIDPYINPSSLINFTVSATSDINCAPSFVLILRIYSSFMEPRIFLTLFLRILESYSFPLRSFSGFLPHILEFMCTAFVMYKNVHKFLFWCFNTLCIRCLLIHSSALSCSELVFSTSSSPHIFDMLIADSSSQFGENPPLLSPHLSSLSFKICSQSR